jgi:hypothetical protein
MSEYVKKKYINKKTKRNTFQSNKDVIKINWKYKKKKITKANLSALIGLQPMQKVIIIFKKTLKKKKEYKAYKD